MVNKCQTKLEICKEKWSSAKQKVIVLCSHRKPPLSIAPVRSDMGTESPTATLWIVRTRVARPAGKQITPDSSHNSTLEYCSHPAFGAKTNGTE